MPEDSVLAGAVIGGGCEEGIKEGVLRLCAQFNTYKQCPPRVVSMAGFDGRKSALESSRL